MPALPHSPNLRHLRRQARELQRASGSALHECQHELARSYGVRSWMALPIVLDDPAWRVRFEAVISIVQQPASDASRDVLARVAERDPDARVRDKGAWALRVHRGERWTYGRKGA